MSARGPEPFRWRRAGAKSVRPAVADGVVFHLSPGVRDRGFPSRGHGLTRSSSERHIRPLEGDVDEYLMLVLPAHLGLLSVDVGGMRRLVLPAHLGLLSLGVDLVCGC